MRYVQEEGRYYRTVELATWHREAVACNFSFGRYVMACGRAGAPPTEVLYGGGEPDLQRFKNRLPSLAEENPGLVFVADDIESLYSSLQKFALERVGYVR